MEPITPKTSGIFMGAISASHQLNQRRKREELSSGIQLATMEDTKERYAL